MFPPPPPVTRLRTPTFQGTSEYWQHLPPGGWPTRPPPSGVHAVYQSADFQTYTKHYGSGDGQTVVDDNQGRPLCLQSPSPSGLPSVPSLPSASSSPLKTPVYTHLGTVGEGHRRSSELSNPPSVSSNFESFTSSVLPPECNVTVCETSVSEIVKTSMNIAGITSVSAEEKAQQSGSSSSDS